MLLHILLKNKWHCPWVAKLWLLHLYFHKVQKYNVIYIYNLEARVDLFFVEGVDLIHFMGQIWFLGIHQLDNG